MKRLAQATILAAALAAWTGRAEMLSETWGGKGPLAHPGTLTIDAKGESPRLVFDLSAIPKGAAVYHASLRAEARGGQPREPVRLYVPGAADAPGEPLRLEAPWYDRFDATEAAARWVKNPAANRGLLMARFDGFDARSAVLEVRYEGKPDAAKLPPQVDQLKVVHHDGQTFLTWRELPMFRPAPDKIVWIDDYADYDKAITKEPGTSKMGNPRIPGLRLDTLRVDLQGLEVRTKPGAGQEYPPFVRIRELPDVAYRIWRSDKPITSETIKNAALVGEAKPLSIYDMKMLRIYSSGEYYGKHEQGDNIIGTFCIADFQGVLPGCAYYVHTPDKDGNAYYAVTVAQNGIENALVSAENTIAEPVAEKAEAPKPLKYYVMNDKYRTSGKGKPMSYQFLYYLAPPFANLPEQFPRRIGVGVAGDYKAPGPMLVNQGLTYAVSEYIMLGIESSGDLVYSSGRGTLLSFQESKLDSFPERYFFHIVSWARAQWQADPALTLGMGGMSLHMAIRHPEVFGMFSPNYPSGYEMDFDQKWNPAAGSLMSRVGPPDLVKAPDGSPGWNIFDIAWYLKQEPGKDIPFMACLFSQPKDGNHGAEYGWQDDPKGYAALRDSRQPYLAQWGGGGIAREVRDGLIKLRWDKSVPAFSNCNLDNNPGTGDPDAGEPWGQINGYLFWDYGSIVDEADHWEMTVYLVPSCPEDSCTVDLTPRHRQKFNPKAGAKLRWTNTGLADGKVAESGEVMADERGLTTLKGIPVAKGRNRIVIAAR